MSEHLFTAAVYYFLKQFFFYPSTCVVCTSYTTRLFCVCHVFDVFTLPHGLYWGKLQFSAQWDGQQRNSAHIHAEVWRLRVRRGIYYEQKWGKKIMLQRKTRKSAVSYRRFPSLHTCIIQLNIFPFYGPKYSWMIRAQGELVQNLANLWKLASCAVRFGLLFFFVSPLSLKQDLYPNISVPCILCYVTPSPVNEIMNSRLDTEADEGTFEHSKRERGEKQGENIPKINFHLQGSCIFNRERLNIIG